MASVVHKKADGLMLVKADQSVRYLTAWESVMYRLTKAVPAK